VLLEVPTHGAPSHGSSACFRYGDASDVEAVGALSGESEDELGYVRARLDAGDRVVLGHVDGRLAFYAWLMFGHIEVGARIAPVSSDVAHSYKVFTAPDFRGRGVAASYYDHVRPLLASEGYSSILATVRRDNEASLRAHHKAGFTRVGRLWDAKLGPWSHTVIGPRTRGRVGAR
jgi:GNAT superfamily N-acetyltransferase